jgi:hypothetical protein
VIDVALFGDPVVSTAKPLGIRKQRQDGFPLVGMSPPDLAGVARDVEAGHLGRAGGRWQERDQHLDGGRLAGAVAAEKPADGTRGHLEVQAA